MRSLIESVAQATSHLDRDDLDVAVARLVAEMVDPDRVTVYRVLLDGGQLRAQRWISIVRNAAPIGPDNAAIEQLPRLRDVAAWNECALLGDVVHHAEPSDADGRRTQCSVYPVCSQSMLRGLIEISIDAARPALRPRDARMIAAALRIVGNHLALLDYGEHDTLTGMLNRKTFESTFEKVRDRLRNAARKSDDDRDRRRAAGETRDTRDTRDSHDDGGLPSWLAVVDIDRFKSINDGFGHLFGDEVLLLVSRLMRDGFRGADRIFRFGGEEFTILVERTSEGGAAIALERLRANIEAWNFPKVGRVTISAGMTRIAHDEASMSAFERADEALYFAKNHGRNQVHCYERLVAASLLRARQHQLDIELF